MAKIVRLNESDLTRIVKRIISEQEQQELAFNIVNSPKLRNLADQALSSLSVRELISLKRDLDNIGIDKNTSLSDAMTVGNIAVQQSKEQSELSEDEEESEEKLNFIDKVRMGMSSLGLVNTALYGRLGSSLVEIVADYLNINTSASTEQSVSLAIGIVIMLIGNTVYDKLKRMPHKD
jgi:hypothetical protein